jgi:hypothetical protein
VGDTEARRRPDRRDIPLIVAILSLIAALVFSAIQARDSAQSIHQTKQSLDQTKQSLILQSRANDFQTLISVTSTLQRSHAQLIELILHRDNTWSKRPIGYGVRLAEALRPNEPIAFALNHHLVALAGAQELWGNLLVCNRQTVGYAEGMPPLSTRLERQEVAPVKDVPELVKYVTAYERSHPDPDEERCSGF